ncbi:uncharacterized protein LOC143199151 isoform X2 [Rhynchophorus ferrugineus]|uniref:uncharacterized protein LOC143199151 isoform X2 n=1 Tax=Rhynchophorus ferrugineus TaxID=354439 RepID=UPI003FCC72C3
MNIMTELQNALPPGWDCVKDEKTGRLYYVNHLTKTTTWEHPRSKHVHYQTTSRHLNNVPTEHIPLQYGSPEFKRNYVYPSHSPPIHAFQLNSHTFQIQDMKPSRNPLTLKPLKIKDSSFCAASSHSINDAEDTVAKIGAMFPTVSENHIKLLLKKYLNREALVISALQVDKYPITTPGPFSTPPPQRNINVSTKGPPSNTGSPVFRGLLGAQAFRNSPRPHSSPKLKLRYMKSIFPRADETIILEVLQNNDNSIQRSSDVLRDMGYEKKETVKPSMAKVDPVIIEKPEDKKNKVDETPVISTAQIMTIEDKQILKEELQKKYKDVAEHLITIALESVNYDENRASQILKIMKQEDSKNEQIKNNQQTKEQYNIDDLSSKTNTTLPISQSRQSIKSLLKMEKKDDVFGFCRIVEEIDLNPKYSKHLSNTVGHNPDLCKGPNENLLLENYVQWQGSNKSIQKGTQGLAKGPNKNLLTNKVYVPRGPNVDFCKGPTSKLAKGNVCQSVPK